MALSDALVSQFVKVTKDKEKKKIESKIYGTAVVDDGGKIYVRLDGSELLTPVETTTIVHDEDRVMVTIKDHEATITGNITSPSALNEDLENLGIVLADKVSTKELEAAYAVIDNLKTNKLDVNTAEITYATIDSLKASDAEIDKLKTNKLDANYAAANYATIGALNAANADIDDLRTKKLDAESAEIKYANIDFANIGQAAFEKIFSSSGIIKDLIFDNGTITGELVGVTIKGDLIEGNTVVADKLVIKGEDGLYYKLNTDGVTTEAEQTDYNSLNGSIITAKSITATKISVDDLVAFDATIGGFNITDSSLYSGVKSSATNTTRGVYLDKDGQLSVGDSNNYLRYYKDTDDTYKLEISAKSLTMSTTNKTVEETLSEMQGEITSNNKTVNDTLSEMQTEMGTIKESVTTNLRIESSKGTVFKTDEVSTVLSAIIYRGASRITDITTLRTEMGSSAYLQWSCQNLNDETFSTILSTDSRLGNDGFTLTLSPTDVDTKVTFMCQLMAE